MLRIPYADDLHCHLRQGRLVSHVCDKFTFLSDRVLVMPNTTPPVTTCAQAGSYRQQLLAIEPRVDYLMTLYLTHDLSADDLRMNARLNNVQGVKCYPVGTTTNSQHGFRSLEEFYPIFSVMEELGLSLHVHGEQPGSSPLSAEAEFIPHVEHVARSFPRLKVVAEHVSTKASLDAVSRIPNLAASVTPHHLFLTTDDVLSELDGVTLDNIASHIKNPHLYCKPLAKSAADRDALLQAVKSRSAKIFLGSDSAPHTLAAKSSANPPAGIYTQPFLMNYVATIFKQLDRLDFLEAFACRNGAAFLGLPPKELNCFELGDQTFTVPPTVDDILVPFLSGHELLKIKS